VTVWLQSNDDMDNITINRCLVDLEQDIDGVLSRQRFRRIDPRMPETEFEWRRWAREASWKRDIVDLAIPRTESIKAVGFVDVHLRCRLRYLQDDEGLFDGVSVSALSGERAGRYPFPSTFVFKRWVLARYRRKILRDTAHAIRWFDDYSTPKQCLEKLGSGQASVGPVKETGAARRPFDFLSSLVATET
jgi:hypothetical protein